MHAGLNCLRKGHSQTSAVRRRKTKLPTATDQGDRLKHLRKARGRRAHRQKRRKAVHLNGQEHLLHAGSKCLRKRHSQTAAVR